MKRFFLMLLCILLCSSAFGESVDYASMTDEQLQIVINSARNELAKRSADFECLVNDEYVRITKTGSRRFGSYTFSNEDIRKYVQMEVIVENVSGTEFELITDGVSINGWETDPVLSRSGTIGIGMKKICYIEMVYTEAKLSDYSEIQDVVISLRIGNLFDTIKEYKINMVLNQSE